MSSDVDSRDCRASRESTAEERREARELAKHARHVMHAEMKAAIAVEIRQRQSAARVVDALEMQHSLEMVRGEPLRLEDSRNLEDVHRIAINRGAQILEDLALNAPDWDVRAKCANWLMLGGIELRRLEAERRGETLPQPAVQFSPAVLEALGPKLEEHLQLQRKLAARGA